MEEMTASEILRRNADDNWSDGVAGIAIALDVEEYNGRVFELLANKIDIELAEAKKKAAYSTDRPLSEVMAYYTGLYAKGAEPIGDWLDRWFVPRPRYEDGEPLRFDYDTDELNGIEKFIFLRSGGGCCQMQDADGNICNVYPGERVKRPATEVLGADGLPIEVGETVWSIHGIHEGIVKALNVNMAHVEWSDGRWSPSILCDKLTHTPPDTQQKIDDDATMPPAEYCAVRGIDLGDDPDRATATEAMALDLLRRQRELDAKEGE